MNMPDLLQALADGRLLPVATVWTLLLALVCLWMLPGLVVWRRARTGRAHLDARLKLAEQQLTALQSQLALLAGTGSATSRHLGDVRTQLQSLAERPPAAATLPPLSSGYLRAVDLAGEGANADDLVQSCGLSAGEAQLLVSFHQLERASA